jgi:predicted secreted hydrolase
MKRHGLLVAALLLAGCAPPADIAAPAPVPLARSLALGDDAGGFEQVVRRELLFPADHGAHPRFRIEWWYITARLRDPGGRRFGAQFALFRFALRPQDDATRDDWQGAQVYMVHAAVSDLDRGGFHHVERFARGAAGLAGVDSNPYRGWLGDCRAESTHNDALFPLTLDCGSEDFRYRLELFDGGPRVLHGESGFSSKSDLPGAASHYYAYPFIAARGEIALGDETHAVTGAAWYDHEWTSSLLGADQVGWDWFSLRLSDGSALMLFHIRDRAGAIVSSRGTLIEAGGEIRTFSDGTISAEPTRLWTSPASGVRYPLGWRLRSDTLDLELDLDAVLDAQELDTTVRYWEGAIDARGRRGGKAVSAEGYLELTGYGE